MSSLDATTRKRLATPYMCSVIVAGFGAFVFAVYRLPGASLDLSFIILSLITILVGARVTIEIPRFKSEISISDSFIFLIMLLYGPAPAIVVAGIESAFASLRIARRTITFLFNPAVMSLSTLLTATMVQFLTGDIIQLTAGAFSGRLVLAGCIMALVQYATNSGLVSVAGALRSGNPVWNTWRRYYLWSSITYFAGASAAVITAKLVVDIGLHAALAMIPVIAIVHFTYRTYLRAVETSAAQAEQAERHVEELSRYITEQERIREQFSQMEKLSALGELASGVAHDFNNTLAGILGRAQLLLRTKDQEKIERGLRLIIRSAEDGAKTVKRIQDFARQRHGHDFAPIAVDQLLLEVSEFTRPRWKGVAQASDVHIELDLQVERGLYLLGDESELREVLVNMVFNSVDAMPDGGRLTLAAREVDGSIEISVRDTGVGMTPDVRARIFDPFFTTKGKAGLGLGLAVSYGIIRRHEGSVSVESQPGSGTTIVIVLNQAEPDEGEGRVEIDQKRVADEYSDAWRGRILVVDDEQLVRELLQDILVNLGFEVVAVSNGVEGVQAFVNTHFDAVFTDLGMPGMSGWELARSIREHDSTVPIAVVTGWGEVVGSKEQKEAGVNWIVAKPFTTTQIEDLANRVVERRKGPRGRLRVVA